jgi:ribosomal protein L29
MDAFQKMSSDELRREVSDRRVHLQKMRLGIGLGKEKDTAKYQREKRELARMLTALHSHKDTLKKTKKASTVSAS